LKFPKKNTWGGEVELQALSHIFKINFVIYSALQDDPTKIDNGFDRTVLLCYYGNHYDCVYPLKNLLHEEMCQQIVYNIINGALGIKSNHDSYKNIGWEWWVKENSAAQKRDQALAEKFSNIEMKRYNIKDANRYQKKKNMNSPNPTNQEPRFQTKSPNGSSNLRGISTQSSELHEALLAITIREENERKLLEKEEFPALLQVKTLNLEKKTPSTSELAQISDQTQNTSMWGKSKDWSLSFLDPKSTKPANNSLQQSEPTQNENHVHEIQSDQISRPQFGIALSVSVLKNLGPAFEQENLDIIFGNFPDEKGSSEQTLLHSSISLQSQEQIR